MRYLVGLALVVALGLMGCSATSGTGGAAGVGGGGVGGDGGAAGVGGDPFPGNCGAQGQGGGGRYVHPGLYVAFWPEVVLPYQGCVYVSEDCTELEASTKCNIGEDDSQAPFLEVEWTDGRKIVAYVPEERQKLAQDITASAAKVLKFYEEKFGKLKQPRMSITITSLPAISSNSRL